MFFPLGRVIYVTAGCRGRHKGAAATRLFALLAGHSTQEFDYRESADHAQRVRNGPEDDLAALTERLPVDLQGDRPGGSHPEPSQVVTVHGRAATWLRITT